jgi:hypothetical protein
VWCGLGSSVRAIPLPPPPSLHLPTAPPKTPLPLATSMDSILSRMVASSPSALRPSLSSGVLPMSSVMSLAILGRVRLPTMAPSSATIYQAAGGQVRRAAWCLRAWHGTAKVSMAGPGERRT